jgi:hypothetical protein
MQKLIQNWVRSGSLVMANPLSGIVGLSRDRLAGLSGLAGLSSRRAKPLTWAGLNGLT